MMESSQAISAFAALSQETRLAVLRLLIREGTDGIPSGELAARVGVPPSTMSFHIASLERAGLVRSWRIQRQIFYAPNLQGVKGLVTFLLQDCCGGHPEICGDIFAAGEAPCCDEPAEAAPKKTRKRAP